MVSYPTHCAPFYFKRSITSTLCPSTNASSAHRNGLLHLRIQPHHLLVQLGVVVDHDLRVPASSHKDGIDTARNRRGKDVCDLEADQESKGDNDRRKSSILVVARVGEEQVQVRKKPASKANKHGTKRENRSEEAFLQ